MARVAEEKGLYLNESRKHYFVEFLKQMFKIMADRKGDQLSEEGFLMVSN